MKLKDTEVHGNLHVTKDVQIGEISVTEELTKLNNDSTKLNSDLVSFSIIEDLDYTILTDVEVYSAFKIGNMAFVSLQLQRGITGTSIQILKINNYVSARTVFTNVGCYGGSDGEVSINTNDNIIYGYISKSNGDTRFQIAFPVTAIP